jgi:hypothetical protein
MNRVPNGAWSQYLDDFLSGYQALAAGSGFASRGPAGRNLDWRLAKLGLIELLGRIELSTNRNPSTEDGDFRCVEGAGERTDGWYERRDWSAGFRRYSLLALDLKDAVVATTNDPIDLCDPLDAELARLIAEEEDQDN